jgi:hypothetical protein
MPYKNGQYTREEYLADKASGERHRIGNQLLNADQLWTRLNGPSRVRKSPKKSKGK